MLALVNMGVHLIPLQAVHFKVIRAVHLKCRNHFISMVYTLNYVLWKYVAIMVESIKFVSLNLE